jgi:hypothetical protein
MTLRRDRRVLVVIVAFVCALELTKNVSVNSGVVSPTTFTESSAS